jgi:hypothetical protein
MSYRSDVDALAARHAALASQVEELSQQCDDAARLLAEAKARAKLPILDGIRTASPCHEPWDNMVGNDRVRACARCKLDVYNLSAMTRDEAEALIIERRGNLCARYFRRSDGTILTADCAVGAQRQRQRRWIAAAIGATVAVGGAIGVELRQPEGAQATPRTAEVEEAQARLRQLQLEVETGRANMGKVDTHELESDVAEAMREIERRTEDPQYVTELQGRLRPRREVEEAQARLRQLQLDAARSRAELELAKTAADLAALNALPKR